MKKILFDAKEQEIIKDFEAWEFKRVDNYEKEKKSLMNATKNSIKIL